MCVFALSREMQACGRPGLKACGWGGAALQRSDFQRESWGHGGGSRGCGRRRPLALSIQHWKLLKSLPPRCAQRDQVQVIMRELHASHVAAMTMDHKARCLGTCTKVLEEVHFAEQLSTASTLVVEVAGGVDIRLYQLSGHMP